MNSCNKVIQDSLSDPVVNKFVLWSWLVRLFLLFGVLTYSAGLYAQQEQAGPAAEVRPQSEPAPRMTQRLYELYHYYFWENLNKQVFEKSDYSEQYVKDAEAVIDQFCRHLTSSWNNQFLKNPNPPQPARECIEMAGRFLERYDKHEPLSFLIACNMYFAPSMSSSSSMYYLDICELDPGLIRETVEQLVTNGYPRFVEIYGRAFLRHVLLRSTYNFAQAKSEARDEAFEQHGIMVDTIYGLLLEGCEAQPGGLDEQALYEAIKRFWCMDDSAISDKYDRFGREFALLDRSLDKPDMKHAWVALIFQAYYHNEVLIDIQRGSAKRDADGKYHGLTFGEHQQAALAVINAAWEMYPDRPHAAFFGMNVSMGISPDAVHEWFKKGDEINGLVIPGMYGNYCNWLMHRGDDYKQMLDFACSMVEGGRFDTEIPDQMYWTMWRIHQRTGKFPYFEHEGFYEHFKKYCEGRAANPTDTKGQKYWNSALFFAAVACGQDEEAQKVLANNGNFLDPGAAQVLSMTSEEAGRLWSELQERQHQKE